MKYVRALAHTIYLVYNVYSLKYMGCYSLSPFPSVCNLSVGGLIASSRITRVQAKNRGPNLPYKERIGYKFFCAFLDGVTFCSHIFIG